jgi:hypothetical protein
MADPESRAARLLAEYYEMPLAETAVAFSVTLAAFKQAMAEFGIPEHPGGKCPSPGCQCSPLEMLVTVRAEELLGLAESEGGEGDG